MLTLGGGGLSGAEELDRPHREGLRLARNDVLALPDFPSLPAINNMGLQKEDKHSPRNPV